jgi:hypothetical protein
MQFFTLYDLLIMPGFQFPGEKFPTPDTVKMVDLGVSRLVGITKD